jgi:polyhydroxyalkanoate synthesis regulator phasin
LTKYYGKTYDRNKGGDMGGSTEEEESKEAQGNIDWHLAFFQALQLELEANWDDLSYIHEHHLSRKPLRIDVIIVKKEESVVIESPIGKIFRKCNIVEYKGPDDNVSIEDYYKVMGYMYIYMSIERVAMRDITITFVEPCYPEKLFKHLEEDRGFKVTESESGIYQIEGDFVPVQLIKTQELSREASRYLWTLSKELNVEELSYVMRSSGKAHKLDAGGYLQAVLRGNPQKLEEVMKMGAITFEEVLDKYGYINKNELDKYGYVNKNELDKYGYVNKNELDKLQAEVQQLRSQIAELQAK